MFGPAGPGEAWLSEVLRSKVRSFEAKHCRVWHVLALFCPVRLGRACWGMAGCDAKNRGLALLGFARSSPVRFCLVRRGRVVRRGFTVRGLVLHVTVRSCPAWYGRVGSGKVRQGVSWSGIAVRGPVLLGHARFGSVGCCGVWLRNFWLRSCWVMRCLTGNCAAKLATVFHGRVRSCTDVRGSAVHGVFWRGETSGEVLLCAAGLGKELCGDDW